MKSRKHLTIGILIRVVAILACGWVLIFRCYLHFGAASRLISQAIQDINAPGSHESAANNLDLARNFINTDLDNLLFATLALLLLSLFPYANLKWKSTRRKEAESTGGYDN